MICAITPAGASAASPNSEKVRRSPWIAAADQGYARAQYNLARMYAQGHGIPANPAEAGIWYRKAADQGLARAQYALACVYYEGRGLPQETSWRACGSRPSR